jgi:ATP-dependent Clp protease ATP-binding subunit ClpA
MREALRLKRESCDPTCRRVLDDAEQVALEAGRYQIFPEHLMLALVSKAHDVRRILHDVGVDPTVFLEQLKAQIVTGTDAPALPIPLSPRTQRALNGAYDHCFQLRKGVLVQPGDLLLGIVDDPDSVPGKLWASLSVDRAVLARQVEVVSLGKLVAPPVLRSVGNPIRWETATRFAVSGCLVVILLFLLFLVSAFVFLQIFYRI